MQTAPKAVQVRLVGPDGLPTGQIHTLSLGISDVVVSEELSSYLGGYHPTGFRADEVSPVILVDRDKDLYRDFSSDDAFRKVDVKGSIEGAIPEVDPVSATTEYKVIDRFLGSFVNRIVEQNATKLLQPRQQALKRISWALLLDREIDTWNLLQALASWDAAQRVTLAAGFQWNGGASSDPLLDLQTRTEASAQGVTGIWMNDIVGNAMLRHPSIKDHMRQFLGDGAPNAMLQNIANAAEMAVDFKIPGLPPIHIVSGRVKNEATGALDRILGNHVVLTTQPNGIPTDGESIATTYTFRRRGAAGVGFESREVIVELRGPKGGTMVVVSQADVAVMTGSNVGGLIRDAVQ